MRRLSITPALALLSCAFLLAESVRSDSLPSDAAAFSRYDLYLYIAEHTQSWPEGAVFYSDAGTLRARWEGQCVKGKWSTTDDDRACHHLWSTTCLLRIDLPSVRAGFPHRSRTPHLPA
ncbi:MAG: DUF995 domain-containing protein, partial [Pseudomonadota bacterium]